MRLLLISNSGRPPFAHCAEEIAEHVGPDAVIGFVTAASLGDEDAYVASIREHLVAYGAARGVEHVDWRGDWRTVLATVQAVFVGGGNTYSLLQRLTTSGLGRAIREHVEDGLPYLGSSAGANIAGPNILTTNDWNVVGSTTFEGLSFVPWNINPHYATGLAGGPGGETRDDRIREYHLVRSNPILAIEEGGLVEVNDGIARVRGTSRVRLFVVGQPDRWVLPGEIFAADTIEGDRPHRGTTTRALRAPG